MTARSPVTRGRPRGSRCALLTGAAGVAVTILALACSRDGEPASTIAVRDSSGVRIVENRTPLDSLPIWRVADEPATVFGDEGPDGGLYRVTGAVRLNDGRVAVGLGGEMELRVYDPDGTLAWRYGGEGEGPGEFRSLVPVASGSGRDSIRIWDFVAGRVTGVDASGVGASFVRLASTSLIFSPELAGPTGEGVYLLAGLRTDSERRGTRVYARYDGEGRLLGQVDAPVPRVVHRKHGNVSLPLMFSARSRFAAGSDGFWIGPGDREEVRQYDPQGALARIVRWPAEDRRVRETDIERMGSMEFVTPLGRETIDPADYGFAERFPAHADLKVDRANRVWIQRYRRPGESGPSTWMVFDLDGHLVAKAEVPTELHVHDVGKDWILGVTQEETGLERVEIRNFDVNMSTDHDPQE